MRSLNIHGRNWNNTLRNLCVWGNWAARIGHTQENPFGPIGRIKIDPAPPAILTPMQARAILDAAQHTPLRAYMAAGLFGGIRPAELYRLTWTLFDWDAAHIHLPAAITKIRTHERHVTIYPALAAWAHPIAQPDGAITLPYGTPFRDQFRAIITAAQVSWSQDVMRHTFASYHLAHWRNAAETALQLGHRDPNLLFSTYRRHTTPETAAEFWALRPSP